MRRAKPILFQSTAFVKGEGYWWKIRWKNWTFCFCSWKVFNFTKFNIDCSSGDSLNMGIANCIVPEEEISKLCLFLYSGKIKRSKKNGIRKRDEKLNCLVLFVFSLLFLKLKFWEAFWDNGKNIPHWKNFWENERLVLQFCRKEKLQLLINITEELTSI